MVMVSLLTFPSSSSHPIALYTQASLQTPPQYPRRFHPLLGIFSLFPCLYPFLCL